MLEGVGRARSARGALGEGDTVSADAAGRGLGFGRAIGVADSPAVEGVGVTWSELGEAGAKGATGAPGVEIDAGWLGCWIGCTPDCGRRTSPATQVGRCATGASPAIAVGR